MPSGLMALGLVENLGGAFIGGLWLWLIFISMLLATVRDLMVSDPVI